MIVTSRRASTTTMARARTYPRHLPSTVARSVAGVTPIDIAIVVIAAFFGFVGFARGFLIGVLSLVGFAGGAYLGTRFGPQLLSEGNASPYAPLFGLLGALLGGVILSAGRREHRGRDAVGDPLARLRALRRPARQRPGGRARARAGLAGIRDRAADAGHPRRPPADPALRDPQGAQRDPAVRQGPQGARALRSAAEHPRPAGQRRAAAVQVASDPDVQAAGRLGRARAVELLRPRRRGLGLGRRARASS